MKTCPSCPSPSKCKAQGKCAKTKMAAGGALKSVPTKNVGLKKLPTNVRNKMGYMKKGGMAKKYNKGGYANCGASAKPNGKSRT